ncbi:unnamed protein product [Schistosoma margrebowiei]|uniref:Uncharacterized protein n=1 Tax=Schistosoma margrebowiei TaxID=48269 RepID=A0A183M3Z2_9TREM|nr:unnamed protein product [Schistosoma margrebowiei]
MRTSTSDGKHRIKWTGWMQLNILNFADDLAFLLHSHRQIQLKTTSFAAVSASVGLNLHKGKVRSSNTAQGTPAQSRIWVASSMNKEDLTQT